MKRTIWLPIGTMAVWLAAALGSPRFLNAQQISAVEEDWTLVLNTPNATRSSPQINCVISPLSGLSSIYAVVAINQHTVPSGTGGGLQLQLWNNNAILDVSNLSSTASLSATKEKVQWTTRMSVANSGELTVEILSGSSDTWGKFGSKGELVVTAKPGLANLNAYSPDLSTENSGIEYGMNRVEKLVLNKVRVYEGKNKSVEQALDRVVYPK